MKAIDKFCITLFFLVILNIYGCTNKYEKEAIGKYKISFCQSIDSATNLIIDSSVLVLFAKNKFSLSFNNKSIYGVWEAGDNGDYTWIKFSDTNNMRLTEGIIGVNNIMIFTPSSFYYPKLEKLTYHKF